LSEKFSGQKFVRKIAKKPDIHTSRIYLGKNVFTKEINMKNEEEANNDDKMLEYEKENIEKEYDHAL